MLLITFLISTTSATSGSDNYNLKHYKIELVKNKIKLQFRITDNKGNAYAVKNKNNLNLTLNNRDVNNFKIKAVSKNISAVILIDASGSINEATRTNIKNEVNIFLKTLRRNDEVGVFTFNDLLIKNLNLSVNKKPAYNIITQLASSGSFSKIYDALIKTSIYLNTNAKYDNKAIIVISDGLDEGSSAALQDVIKTAKDGDIAIYSIGFSNINPVYFNSLKAISSATGGMFATQTSEELSKRIATILKTRNVLTFDAKELMLQNTLIVKASKLNINERINFTLAKKEVSAFNSSMMKQNKDKITLIIFYIIIALVLILFFMIYSKRKYHLTYLERAELFGFIKFKLLNNESDFFDFIHKLTANKAISRTDIEILLKSGKKAAKLIDKENSLLLNGISKVKKQAEKKNVLPKQIIGWKNISVLKKIISERKDCFNVEQKNLISNIILKTIRKRLSDGITVPLTLSEYDFFLTLTEKRQFLQQEILSLLKIFNEYKAEPEERKLLKSIIDILKELSKANKSYTGHLISDVYLSEIRSMLKDFEKKLKALSKEEKDALLELAISNLYEDMESRIFYKDIAEAAQISSSKLEELYRRLSLELMHINASDEIKTFCCSALFKMSMLASEKNKSYDIVYFFGEDNFKLFIKEYEKKHKKRINEKLFNELNMLREDFKNENNVFLSLKKEDCLKIKREADFDNAVENILYRIYSINAQGYSSLDISELTSKYSPDIIAKLIPFVIQIVKDSEGSQKQAGESILKNLASSLKFEDTDVAKIDNWEKWWKKNKGEIQKKACCIEETIIKEEEGSLAFSKHEDLLFYMFVNDSLYEAKGHVIETHISGLSAILKEAVPLETIAALFRREASLGSSHSSPYIFLKVMKIEFVDENIYEYDFRIIKDESKVYLKQLEKLITS